jgi:hypothetical protein
VCTHGVRGVGCAWWCVVDDGTTGTLALETWPRKTLRSPPGSGHHAQSVLPCEQFAHAHPPPACACGQCRATWCVQTAVGEPPGSAGCTPHADFQQTSTTPHPLPTPTHTFTSASIWCSRMGLLQNSTKGLGLVKVKGRSRVPKPPTRIRAFSVCHEGCIGRRNPGQNGSGKSLGSRLQRAHGAQRDWTNAAWRCDA